MNTLAHDVSLVAEQRSISPAPVRVAIVGTNFGAGIARNLAAGNPAIDLCGICDLDAAKAGELAAELDVPAFSDLDDLLAEPEIEAIGLFTSPAGRAGLISKILRSGRHVMTTKPFELDIAASSCVLAEAQELGLALHLNSPSAVPSQDIAQIQRWIVERDLGAPIAMRAETWCRYHEQENGTWYDDPARCPAAPIFRLGVYFLNEFAAFLGEPSRVHVMHSRVLTGRPTADNAQMSIEFETGALANIFASFCTADGMPYSDRVTLNFERGTVTRWVERKNGVCMAGDHAVAELRQAAETPVRAVTEPGAFAGWYDWRAFRDAIRGIGNVPLQNGEAVLFGVRLLDAMRRSAFSGMPEKVRRY